MYTKACFKHAFLNQYPISATFILTICLLLIVHNSKAEEPLCFGDDGIVCINEVEVERLDGAETLSYYTIENNLNVQLFAFGVTNTVRGEGAFVGTTYQGAWSAKTFTQAEWDASLDVFEGFENGEKRYWRAGELDQNDHTSSLGSFESLFGQSQDINGNAVYVNFYWNTNGGFYYLRPNHALLVARQFNFYGSPESEATVFARSGAVVATTVSPVPELHQSTMLLLGLFVLCILNCKEAIFKYEERQ